MTRIAASQPAIWLDILTSNRDAVLGALDAYLAGLQHARDIVAAGDREALKAMLDRARAARRNLPVGISMATKLVELRIPVPDRPGVLAEVTTLAGRLGVNVADVEIAPLEGGRRGRARADRRGRRRRRVRGRPARSRLPHRSDGIRVSVELSDTGRCPRRRRRPAAARAVAGAGRQVDLAPGADLRRARRGREHDHESRDRRRRARPRGCSRSWA